MPPPPGGGGGGGAPSGSAPSPTSRLRIGPACGRSRNPAGPPGGAPPGPPPPGPPRPGGAGNAACGGRRSACSGLGAAS